MALGRGSVVEGVLIPMGTVRLLLLGLCLAAAALVSGCDDAIELARAAYARWGTEAGPPPPARVSAGAPGVEVPGGSAGPVPTGVAVTVGDPLVVGAATSLPRPILRDAVRRTPPSILPDRDFESSRFRRPEHVRAIYVNAWAAGSDRRMSELLDIARDTEVNAFVIDIKDATGYLSYRSGVPLAETIGANGDRRIPDLPALLDRLEAEDVYPIARIVIVKDPVLTSHRPEYAIQDTAGGVWVDRKGIVWLNPYSKEVWAYHVALAREVAEMGFPEIQWDYVRFPDAPKSDLGRAVYAGRDGRSRPEAIRAFLDYARVALADVPARATADVFGVTTTYDHDVGTGQVWEDVIDVVDVALPMVYPSHYYAGSFGFGEPNAHPYEVVRNAIEDALERSATVEGAGLTRPWLQDFTLGQPVYGGAEVRAQIQATYDAGVQEWVLWNPGSHYTVAALEPVGGFAHEPLVRVAGVLAPVSRRHAVIDSVAAFRARTRLAASDRPVGSASQQLAAAVDSMSAPALHTPAAAPPAPSPTRIVLPPIERSDSLPPERSPPAGRIR